MKKQINILKLVYPPISNQEAEWFKNDPEVAEVLRESNLYMIVQRHESKFHILNEDDMEKDLRDNFLLRFKFTIGDLTDDVEINLNKLIEAHGINFNDYDFDFELGPKQIRIWISTSDSDEKRVLDWFTTEKILWDKWRGHPAIFGLTNFRKFSQYYLHYVGISTKEDSLTRLVVKPHDKRLRILSNEFPVSIGSRLTDEVILLFFKIEPLEIQVYDENDDINNFIYGMRIDKSKIIADAERAFIKIMDSTYNAQKYNNYPQGKGLLNDQNLTRYGYIIGESMTLVTDTEEIIGDYVSKYHWAELADMILIEDENVELIKAENLKYSNLYRK
ncbi:hypothetical protein [Sulfuricurvum sp.]|uniref:hypothetical protein n=1 Tax=Sulfuricurvum sp. TaxID=2025608 RepID=UPI002614646F|nr:hypothetical protein [Sulfuricurvum sp.]MDD3596826.1 hypothetical protein [Sulfuricurvum sp.]